MTSVGGMDGKDWDDKVGILVIDLASILFFLQFKKCIKTVCFVCETF